MKCENCQTEHNGNYGSGKFCCEKCSRSFSAKVNREETNKKVSETLKRKYECGELKIPNRPSFKKGYDKNRKILTDEDRQKAKLAFKQKQEEYVKNTPFEKLSKNVKKRIVLNEQNHRCKICGNENQWMGKLLKFHLDHIDGDHYNNNRENIRLICPNCHSQTETYCRNSTKRYSDVELIEKIKQSSSIHAAMTKLNMSTGANYKRFKKLVLETGFEPVK